MNCPYCHQPCERHPWDAKYPDPTDMQWICRICDIYVQILDNKIRRIDWDNIKVKNLFFIAKLFPDPSRFVLYVHTSHSGWKVLLSFDHIPNWTPQTAPEKIKKLLPYL